MSTSDAIRRRFHPEATFGGFTDIDGSIMFYARVHELLQKDAVALDVGCGRGTQDDDPVRVRRRLRILRGSCRWVIGIDVDPGAAANPHLDEFRMMRDPRVWPIEDDSIDLALADFVLEHVPDPDTFFAEASRVLRPGGTFCLRTINARSYLGVASRLVPDRLHRTALRLLQRERKSEDIFATVYRCNTRGKLLAALQRHGFQAAVYCTESEPAYLGFSKASYGLGLAHRRWAPRGAQVGLIAWARRA